MADAGAFAEGSAVESGSGIAVVVSESESAATETAAGQVVGPADTGPGFVSRRPAAAKEREPFLEHPTQPFVPESPHIQGLIYVCEANH